MSVKMPEYTTYEDRVAAAKNIPLALRILYQIGYNPQRLSKNILYDRCDIWFGAARGVVTIVVMLTCWFLSTYASWDIGVRGNAAPPWHLAGALLILAYVFIILVAMIVFVWDAINWMWNYAYDACRREKGYYSIKPKSKPPAKKFR